MMMFTSTGGCSQESRGGVLQTAAGKIRGLLLQYDSLQVLW